MKPSLLLRVAAYMVTVVCLAGFTGGNPERLAHPTEALEAAQAAHVDTLNDFDQRIDRLNDRQMLIRRRMSKLDDQSDRGDYRRTSRRLAARVDRIEHRRSARLTQLDDVTDLLRDVNEDELWSAGYLAEGGQHLDVFLNRILPCESGGEPEPHRAIGHVDSRDRGRAQINGHYWADRIEELFDVDFYEAAFDPWWNGRMAAVVEREQGLRAWYCY